MKIYYSGWLFQFSLLTIFLLLSPPNLKAQEAVEVYKAAKEQAKKVPEYNYAPDIDINEFMDILANNKVCPKADKVELERLKGSVKELTHKDPPSNLSGDSYHAEKAVFFQYAAKSAAAAAKCRSGQLKSVQDAKEYTDVEKKAIDRIAKNLDQLNELAKLADGYDRLHLKDDKNAYQAQFNTLWNSLWMIDDPKMQAFVKNLINSNITGAQFAAMNKDLTTADKIKPDALRVFAQSSDNLSDAARVAHETATGNLTYSFRKGAISAMYNEAIDIEAQYGQATKTGDFRPRAKEQLVLYSDAFKELNRQGFKTDGLRCRLNSEFISGAKVSQDAIDKAITGASIVTAPVSFLGEGLVAGGGIALEVVAAANAFITLDFVAQIDRDCRKAKAVVNSCTDGKDWQSSQVRSIEGGSCAADLAMAALAGTGGLKNKMAMGPATGMKEAAVIKQAAKDYQIAAPYLRKLEQQPGWDKLSDAEKFAARYNEMNRLRQEGKIKFTFNATEMSKLSDPQRIEYAEVLLKSSRPNGLNQTQRDAVIAAHREKPGFGKGTQRIDDKRAILAKAGFTPPEQKKLLGSGITGRRSIGEAARCIGMNAICLARAVTRLGSNVDIAETCMREAGCGDDWDQTYDQDDYNDYNYKF